MGVELDPGTGGAVVASDTIAGEEFQLFKLVDGAEDGTARIGGDATNGLDVDVTRLPALPAGTNNIGDVDVLTLPATPAGSNEIGGVNVTKVAGTAVAVNSGSLSAGVQRVTLATDQVQLTNALKVDGSAVTQPVSGTVTATPTGTQAVSNAGTFVTQENGAGLTALQLLDDTIIADDAAFTVATTKVSMAGFLADQASTDSVNEGDAGAARMTLDRKQIVTFAPSADTEGWLIARDLDLDETELEIKATAGKLDGYYIYNDGAAEVYVKLYNAAAAAVTVGTTTPIATIPIPAGSAANLTGLGLSFSTGICAAATTGVADADTTAPALNQVVANFFYA